MRPQVGQVAVFGQLRILVVKADRAEHVQERVDLFRLLGRTVFFYIAKQLLQARALVGSQGADGQFFVVKNGQSLSCFQNAGQKGGCPPVGGRHVGNGGFQYLSRSAVRAGVQFGHRYGRWIHRYLLSWRGVRDLYDPDGYIRVCRPRKRYRGRLYADRTGEYISHARITFGCQKQPLPHRQLISRIRISRSQLLLLFPQPQKEEPLPPQQRRRRMIHIQEHPSPPFKSPPLFPQPQSLLQQPVAAKSLMFSASIRSFFDFDLLYGPEVVPLTRSGKKYGPAFERRIRICRW